MTEMFQHAEGALRGFRVLKVGLDPPRDALKARLEKRSRRMFEAGLVEEVRMVLALGFPDDAKAFEAIGYREAIQVIRGQLTLAQAIEDTFIATRQYAKRQRTWFRREPDVEWLRGFGNETPTYEMAIRLVSNFLSA
jgi:tRNA dimethylallyltransferase